MLTNILTKASKISFVIFFGVEDSESDLAFDNIKSNLEDGSIKFVVMMDKLEARLKDLISYINQKFKILMFML